MSVQVRRRREAAAFLATYVGAQGELLVATSNNRVQVHDGATPGGWPAAVGDLPGRNAVLNGTFAINQRGTTGGTALAAGTYAHDRWKAGAGGCTYTFTQTMPDTLVTITAGTLVQAVDAPNVYATAWWLTWAGTAQARVWQGAASGGFGVGVAVPVGGAKVNALLVTGLAPGTVANLEFSAGALGLVQFEAALPNAGPTRFERRHGELSLCQRYARVTTDADNIGGTTASASVINTRFTFPDMRAQPTCSVLTPGSWFITDDSFANNSASPASLVGASSSQRGAKIQVGGFNGLVTGRWAAGLGSPVGTMTFLLSAEL